MKEKLEMFFEFILIAFFMDLLILFWMVVQISQGVEVQHVPFWDVQLRWISMWI